MLFASDASLSKIESGGSMKNKNRDTVSNTGFLDRILPKSDIKSIDRLLEIISAALMALATICSAWGAYQATTWSGVQTFRLNEANISRAHELRYWSDHSQFLTFDSMMLMEYLSATSQGNQKFADLIYSRFRPEVKDVFKAWLSTNPLNNPDAPYSPFIMKTYRSSLNDKAIYFQNLADEKIREAGNANRNGDNYVLLTVLFASVLFFAGIASKFQSRRVRAGMLLFGIVVFVATAIVLATYPVTWSGVSVTPITYNLVR